MKSSLSIFIFLMILSCSLPKSPTQTWNEMKPKILESAQISFDMEMIWENPNFAEFDTLFYQLSAEKFQNEFFPFNYIGSSENNSLLYINNLLTSINHKEKTVEIMSYEEDPLQFEYRVLENTYLNFSPLGLIQKGSWEYLKDTIVDNKLFHDFMSIQMDTTIDTKKVLLQNHLFINPANSLPAWYSRRLYHNGRSYQLIEAFYSNYQFEADTSLMDYVVPSTYVSKVYGESQPVLNLLKKGEKAPDFELVDIQGQTVKLSDFQGQKVFLDFSMINCGWCKIALEKFSSDAFAFSDNIIPLYLNPVDKRDMIEKYLQRIQVPFPVLIDAKEVGGVYGVSGYPSFFLIDEKGIIEFSQVGYSDSLIFGLNSRIINPATP